MSPENSDHEDTDDAARAQRIVEDVDYDIHFARTRFRPAPNVCGFHGKVHSAQDMQTLRLSRLCWYDRPLTRERVLGLIEATEEMLELGRVLPTYQDLADITKALKIVKHLETYGLVVFT